MSYFSELKVKHPDNKFIFYPAVLVALIGITCYYFWGAGIALLAALPVLLISILATVFHSYRGILEEIRNQDIRTQALFNIHSLVSPKLPLPYLSGWAAFPGLINSILGEVKSIKPNHILEIGSGSSTVITSYLLKELEKGSITSLDHDEVYGKKTETELALHGLSDFASVVFTPLVPQEIKGNSYTWYDVSTLDLGEHSVDILVVDGPPEKTQNHARYPALPLFYDSLSEKAVVILDDAGRKEEEEIVAMWLKEYPEFSHEYIYTEKGISVLRRGF